MSNYLRPMIQLTAACATAIAVLGMTSSGYCSSDEQKGRTVVVFPAHLDRGDRLGETQHFLCIGRETDIRMRYIRAPSSEIVSVEIVSILIDGKKISDAILKEIRSEQISGLFPKNLSVWCTKSKTVLRVTADNVPGWQEYIIESSSSAE